MIIRARLYTEQDVIHYTIVNDAQLGDQFKDAVIEIRPRGDNSYVVCSRGLHDQGRRSEAKVWSHPDFGPRLYFSVNEAKLAVEKEWNRKFDWFQKIEG